MGLTTVELSERDSDHWIADYLVDNNLMES